MKGFLIAVALRVLRAMPWQEMIAAVSAAILESLPENLAALIRELVIAQEHAPGEGAAKKERVLQGIEADSRWQIAGWLVGYAIEAALAEIRILEERNHNGQ